MAAGLDGDIKIGLDLQTKTASSALDSFRKKVRDGLSGQGIKGLEQNIKNTEKNIKSLEREIDKTKSKIKDLIESETSPKSVVALERELEKVSTEADTLGKKLEELQIKKGPFDSRGTSGQTRKTPVEYKGKFYSEKDVSSLQLLDNQIADVERRFNSATDKSIELGSKLKELKANPGLTDEGKRYNRELDEATAELEKQKQKLEELQSQQNGFNSTVGSSDIQFKGMQKNLRRIKELIKSALVFSVITKGLTFLRDAMGNVINQNSAMMSSLNQIKANLLTAFAPIWEAIIPWLQTFLNILAKVTAYIAAFINMLMGKSVAASKASAKALQEQAAAANASGSANKKAGEEAEKSSLSFDTLNTISSPKEDAGGDGGGGASTPTFETTDVQITDNIKTILSEILSLATLIGGAIATWKLVNFIKNLKDTLINLHKINGLTSTISFGIALGGIGLFLTGWRDLKEAINDILENGVNFDNATLALHGFTEGVGGIFLALGQLKTGGALLVISALTGIVKDIKSMTENGPNWDNVSNLVSNLGLLAAGIGAFTNHPGLLGAGLFVKGLMDTIRILKENWDAIKEGDWSGVDKIELIGAALTALGGLVIIIGSFVKNAKSSPPASSDVMPSVTESADNLNTGTSALSAKLLDLAKNLAIGILIIGEVAIGLGLFLAAIWGMGWLLEQIGIQWQPVIDNGGTIATAIGIGTALLALVGLACWALGTATVASGGTIAAAIAIGMAMLLEIGAAAALFLAEIWAVGWGLEQIGIQWQPVLDNGDTVSKGLELGSELLLAVGAACAVLGTLAVASVGLLPLAIALGTAMLVKLGTAFTEFTEQITIVAGQIKDKLHPSLNSIISILPDTQLYLNAFIDFMKNFATSLVDFTKTENIKDFKGTVEKLIKCFKDDPIQSLADDVDKQKTQTTTLNEKLELANPELEDCIELITTYYGFLGKLEELTGKTLSINLGNGMFVDMQSVGSNLVLGFIDGIKSQWTSLDTTISDTFDKFPDYIESETFLTDWETSWGAVTGVFKTALNNMRSHMQSFLNNIIGGLNSVIRSTNSVSSKMSGVTGKSYLPISTFGTITLPPLAQGAVLPPNKPFAAVVGDQKHGTNIEAPLDTIVEAMLIALSKGNFGNNGDININFTGNLSQLARVLNPVIEREKKRGSTKLVKGGAH